MRVAAFVHYAKPIRNAGSETVLHEILREHAARGDTVQCVTTSQRGPGIPGRTVFERVEVVNARHPLEASKHVGAFAPDLVYTHHQNAVHAIKQGRRQGWPVVMLVHSDMTVNDHALRLRPDLTVFNTDWIQPKYADRVDTSLVLHPPLAWDTHLLAGPASGEKVTLINLNRDKGAELFYRLAPRLLAHGVESLGVIGGHGQQVIRRNTPGVTIHPHSRDMRPVWEQTALLLMPSIYESFGLVGVEAGVNGIPTVAHPTPGLRESLGDAGVFADRDDTDVWETAILDVLSDPAPYRRRARERAEHWRLRRSIEIRHLLDTVTALAG